MIRLEDIRAWQKNGTFDEKFLEAYDSGEEFTERAIEEMVWIGSVDEIKFGKRRWSETTQSILKMGDRFFSIDWECGLTEMQEDSFMNQPVEVEKVVKEVVAISTTWDVIK
jgi:hypothetical protein